MAAAPIAFTEKHFADAVERDEFSGFLEALAQGGKSWKPKFFIVRDNFLMYYKDDEATKPEGVIPLEEAKIELAPAYERCFEVTTGTRRYHLRASTDALSAVWMEKLIAASLLTIDSLYDTLELLGQGTFAKVKRGREKSTGDEYAIKIIDKADLAENRESILTEISILKNVSHPNVIRLHQIFESKKKIYLVTELLEGGELFDRIVERGHYSEADASRLIRNVVDAIAYLHSKNIVHRDLKPENLLFGADDETIKVTDFGLSKIASKKLKTACGTPGYVAPEILEQEGYGAEVDLWSIGVILYILLCGFPPFYADSDADLYDLIKAAQFSFPSPYWDGISASAKDLISGLLRREPSERLTAAQVIAHPFIAEHATLSRAGNAAIASQLSKHVAVQKRVKKQSMKALGAMRFQQQAAAGEQDDEEDEDA